MKHRVLNGRIYRQLEVRAADTKCAAAHISAERPTPCSVARRFREEVAR